MIPIKDARTAIAELNAWGLTSTPFFFFVDYSGQQWYTAPLDAVDERIRYSFPERRNYIPNASTSLEHTYKLQPPTLEAYREGFEVVQQAIQAGRTRLINLTWRIPFESNLSQSERFVRGKARYMLDVEGMFSVFSPEPFVQIAAGSIATFPMKGTISTAIPNAQEVLLSNPKEAQEHADSVELLKGELALVADEVEVVRYRYCETIANGQVIQTSSEIAGTIRRDLLNRYGDIISALLPGGSIAGTPKASSLEIIAEAETYDRGFYTGIFGIFDGTKLDTSVMIRFIQYGTEGERYFFGGGGVTANSKLEHEYQELLLKANATINHA